MYEEIIYAALAVIVWELGKYAFNFFYKEYLKSKGRFVEILSPDGNYISISSSNAKALAELKKSLEGST